MPAKKLHRQPTLQLHTKGALSVSIDDSETSEKRYTLRSTFTPLPNANKQNQAMSRAGERRKEKQNQKDAPARPEGQAAMEPIDAKGIKPTGRAGVIRAANEDDDLYDPYSDYHDGTLRPAEFEEDPWR